MFSLSSFALCTAKLFYCLIITSWECDANILILQTKEKILFLREYHLRVLCKGIWESSLCHIHGRCVVKSKYFHWKLMAQLETGSLLIKAQQLTSQHMLDELLKIQVTPCEEINCCSSCIRICNMSALEAKWRLFFISLNQNGSLSLQTDVPWKAEAWLYICKKCATDFLLRVGEHFSREIISVQKNDQIHLY